MTKPIFKVILCLAFAAGTLSAQLKRPAKSPAPATAMAPAKASQAASAVTPKPVVDLKPGTWKYKTVVSMPAHDVPIDLSTTISQDGNSWKAVTKMDGLLGTIKNTTWMDKGTLVLRRLEHAQGDIAFHLKFSDNKATGTIDTGALPRQVSTDLTGPIFANGAGSMQSIGCLPLAVGYTVKYRNFDMRLQKEKLMQLKVAGVEKVTVPAGTFQAYRVELTSADGGRDQETVWIAKDTRQPVKISAVLTSMPGSSMTQELEK